MSTRDSDLSPQFGTQMLPNPAASPEQGRRPTVTTATTLLVFGSRRWMLFLGAFETQTASSVTTCQSGVPSTGKTASGTIVDISRFTPGVETPGRGGRLAFGAGGGAGGASWPHEITLPARQRSREHHASFIKGIFIYGFPEVYSARVAAIRFGSSRQRVFSFKFDSQTEFTPK